MEKIKVGDAADLYEIEKIRQIGAGVLEITFRNEIPADWGDITVYTAGGIVATVLTGYETVLQVEGQVVQLTNAETGLPVDPDDKPEPYFRQLERQIVNLQQEAGAVKERNVILTMAATFAATTFSDAQALQVPDLYPEWENIPDGTTLYDGTDGVHPVDRLRHGGQLHKVISTHKKQSDWIPGQETASLYTVIDVEHAGTAEDPIPAAVNVEYFAGKYYIYNDVLYLCTRDSEIALQYTPDQLVGQYFEIAEKG